MTYLGGDMLSTVLILVSLGVTALASLYINLNYNKYKKVELKKRKTGFDVAREILDKNGLSNVLVLETQGELSDHYDPSKKVVKLSHDIYHGTSIAACSVASHECGHAIQDKEGYSFLVFRNKIIPLVNFSSKAGYIAIMIGLLASLTELIWIGIALEVIILLFQLVTLPVEFNASSRALQHLEKMSIVDPSELSGSKKMLTSAALTYVAGVFSAVIQILRLVLIARGSDDN